MAESQISNLKVEGSTPFVYFAPLKQLSSKALAVSVGGTVSGARWGGKPEVDRDRVRDACQGRGDWYGDRNGSGSRGLVDRKAGDVPFQ